MRRISYAFRGDIYVLCLFFFVSLKEKEVLWSSLFEGDALSSLLLILSRCKGLHCLFRFVFTEVQRKPLLSLEHNLIDQPPLSLLYGQSAREAHL
jgi:hypothetical protein